jgi:hypothetical protein
MFGLIDLKPRTWLDYIVLYLAFAGPAFCLLSLAILLVCLAAFQWWAGRFFAAWGVAKNSPRAIHPLAPHGGSEENAGPPR